MPYIKEERREYITPSSEIPETNYILMDGIQCAGDLNYAFTVIIHDYLERQGTSYQNFNDAIGALEGCKLELYRRQVASYEDKKILENGDV